MPTKKIKRPGIVVRRIFDDLRFSNLNSRLGYWEIYATTGTGGRKMTIIALDTRKKHTGSFQFNNRYISSNGKVITGNTGFNSSKEAFQNTRRVEKIHTEL